MKTSFLIFLASLILLSCTTDEQSKRNVLTNGSWIRSSYLSDFGNDGVYEEDTYSMFGDCEKDNIYIFLPEGKEIKDEGPTKCYENATQITSWPWSFSDNGTRLLFEGIHYNIEEITPSTLKLQGRISSYILDSRDVVITFAKL